MLSENEAGKWIGRRDKHGQCEEMYFVIHRFTTRPFEEHFFLSENIECEVEDFSNSGEAKRLAVFLLACDEHLNHLINNV